MLYLAPESSLQLMRYLRSIGGESGLEGTPKRGRRLDGAVNSVRALKELDETAQRWLEHVASPAHAFVPFQEASTSTQKLVTHLLPEPVRPGALLDIGHDVCICTPQFTFLRMAAQVDWLEAILIGMELCGSYSMWRLPPQRTEAAYRTLEPEERGCTFELPKAMQAGVAEKYVSTPKGQRGAVGARAALRWVIDNSASPMETATYLLLCLPKRLGGYGLPKPTLNPKIILNTSEGKIERYPDLYWESRGIDVEYNSDQEHSGDWARHRDSRREVQLAVADVRTLPLTRSQLMDTAEFDEFAWVLRRMLGVRARKPDPDWYWRRDQLRDRLFGAWQQT